MTPAPLVVVLPLRLLQPLHHRLPLQRQAQHQQRQPQALPHPLHPLRQHPPLMTAQF